MTVYGFWGWVIKESLFHLACFWIIPCWGGKPAAFAMSGGHSGSLWREVHVSRNWVLLPVAIWVSQMEEDPLAIVNSYDDYSSGGFLTMPSRVTLTQKHPTNLPWLPGQQKLYRETHVHCLKPRNYEVILNNTAVYIQYERRSSKASFMAFGDYLGSREVLIYYTSPEVSLTSMH